MAIAPLFAPSLDTARRLGERLRELELTREFVGENTEPYSDLRNPLTATRRTALLDEPRLMAIRLLFCDMALRREQCAEVMGAELLGELLEAGYLRESEAGVSFPFQLRHAGPLLLLADYLGADADAVMGPGETTAILYRAGRPLRRLASALDLGCGAGTIALLLAADVDWVVGTDINRRAVAMAQANAALNGIVNADFVAGDLYGPVAGRRFDRILSQPPYYPVKDATLTFLHSGTRGDELARAVVRGLPDHLTEGGRALLFTSWPEDAERPVLHEFQAFELHTNRRELSGTRQSVNVFHHVPGGKGWTAGFEVPADLWGYLRPERIDELMAGQELLHGPEEAMRAASLTAYPVERRFEEAGVVYAQYAPESLLGIQPLPGAASDLDAVREQLGRGLLRC